MSLGDKCFGWGMFCAAMAAAAVGFLLPLAPIAQDILTILILSLAIATVLIMPTAASTADLKGFSYWLAAPAVLRLLAASAVSSCVFFEKPLGNLAALAGQWWLRPSPQAMTIGVIFLSSLALAALLVSGQKITAAGKRFRRDILPLKKMAIHADFKAGILDGAQAEKLKQKIYAEQTLFQSLISAAKLMQFEGLYEFLCFLGLIFIPLNRMSNTEQAYPFFSAAVGLAAISLMPCALTSAAAAYLASKDSLSLRKLPPASAPQSQTFALLNSNSGEAEIVELLNPESVENLSENSPAEQWLAEFEPPKTTPLVETLTCHAVDKAALYRQLTDKIDSLIAETNVAIFAAEGIKQLPVTTAVHPALLLRQKGRRVLLVDGDKERNAIACVFDIDPAETLGKICSTGFEGFDVTSLFAPLDMGKKELFADYDAVIIYAPSESAWRLADQQLSQRHPIAFLFGIQNDQIVDYAKHFWFCSRLVAICPNKSV